MNPTNEELYTHLTYLILHKHCTVVIEDVRPYSLPVSQAIIDTCKFIGELHHRLKNEAGAHCVLVPRSDIKKWVFDAFPEMTGRVATKIDKKCFDGCMVATREECRVNGKTGSKAGKPTFIYIDDRLVTESMRKLYAIPTPAPGKGYKYGLKDDSWQALAAASWWRHKKAP
jgi:hypothetical protein